MKRRGVSGTFLDSAKGRIFLLVREPPVPARGAVLVIPPFAEEMNKCRRMVTEACLALQDHALTTLLPDLHGTGDSEGDFGEADWATWQADIAAAASWAGGHGHPITGLVAIRLGASLALDCVASGAIPPGRRTVLWQPVFDGERHLNQFLRLRLAANLMEGRRETLAELKTQLAGGVSVDVAGYGLSSQLASDLERIRPPSRLPEELGDTTWIEVVRDPDSPLPPPAARLIAANEAAGATRVEGLRIAGEPFWSSTEIVSNQAVVEATTACFADPS